MSTDTFTPRTFPVLDDARTRQVEAAASTRGYAAGYAAGARAAEGDMRRLREQLGREAAEQAAALEERTARALAVLRAAAGALAARTVPVVAEAQDALVATAMDLATAVVGFELADREAAARAALARATATAGEASVRVRLHPEDLRALQRAGVEHADIALVADPALAPGDAVADLEHGFLDARVTTALARARAELADELGRGPAR